ncbi:MAG TPA: cell division protein FtsZ [Chitinophagaceae bacterium]|nr:cell division protein FtsZ [Chitinophagaceae bacterium]MCC6634811.1 cell division protein FtsZ [Chitinophagaceae bacterium]HMZ46097.1 cell division protein FtsZ [Chitinophagaceae bacterium]HNF28643.1 cell division protein FtsZ [Chitinophagaceae bacterium]HNM34320.1 cell division protein FtsZ [Chitinophagaceae bacterium]
MIHFDLPKQKSSIIKVLGVGGGGSNAVNFMFSQNVEGVDFIICNTDAKAIEQSKVPNKIQLGPFLTQGLGAGANPEVGKAATEESLEEIKRILEVNTKMAFITVGMGGGTGTGGAPIIAKICKELGILTVGIVTTPFGFEGPRRMHQAEDGIKQLKPFVDTLLVISNDKLRMQYGNLKMGEAFSKADNILSTAAKCITDIINSRGHIIVDFADVCTVMKNGGVAILGKAEVEGENRAQLAIEEALNSPLLNDSDIKGAKWILININSAEGEHECTMDELEIINNYLRMQAGEHTDVIVGTGYDNNLGGKIGITLVATGFDAKDPFAKPVEVKKEMPKPEKIILTLDSDVEEKKEEVKPFIQQELPLVDKDPYAPRLLESQDELQNNNFQDVSTSTPHNVELLSSVEEESPILHYELSTEITEEVNITIPSVIDEQTTSTTEENNEIETNRFLTKPSNIYAEPDYEKPSSMSGHLMEPNLTTEQNEELPELEMKLVERDVNPVAADDATVKAQTEIPANLSAEEPVLLDDVEEQKRRAVERLQKLRNLSFNVNNTSDPNNEFDSVPAYIRRNMELFGNTLTSVENFYSKYTVNKDENDQTQISTINTFLDGKKPD